MTKLLQPLSTMVPIVDDDGKPTAQFSRALQRLAVSSNLSATDGVIDVAAIAAHMILANKTAGSATPTACSISDILDFLTTTRGSILFRGVSGWQALTPGTANQVLQTNGPGADPTWATAAGGGGSPVSTSFIPTNWTSYTPTAVSTSGALSTYTTTGRYRVLGDIVFVEVVITITNIGTATGSLDVSLPFVCSSTDPSFNFNGRTNHGNRTLNSFVRGDALGLTRTNLYDGTTPFTTTTVSLIFSGSYKTDDVSAYTPLVTNVTGGGGGSSSTYLSIPNFRPNNGTAVGASNFACRGILFPQGCTIYSVGFYATVASGTTTVTPGIYNTTAAGIIGTLLATGPTVSGVTLGLNIVPLTTPLVVTAGTYLWVGFQPLVANPTIGTIATSPETAFFGAAGALPTTAPAATYGTLVAAAIFPRIAP